MRSPFPGMDPYLEDPNVWGDFHHEMIGAIRAQVAAKVSPNFYVRVEERVYLSLPDFARGDFFISDATVIKHPRTTHEAQAAYSTISTLSLVEPLFDPEVKDRYLEIFDKENHEVVTTIELISPINKCRGTGGYDDFWRKRRELFQSQVHWIEIDLLREGARPDQIAGKSDYYALLKRGGQWRPLEVWYFNLRDKMPTTAIPLRPPFQDVPLDLQAAFDVTYERARYGDSVDYSTEPPPPPLRPDDAVWVREQIKGRQADVKNG